MPTKRHLSLLLSAGVRSRPSDSSTASPNWPLVSSAGLSRARTELGRSALDSLDAYVIRELAQSSPGLSCLLKARSRISCLAQPLQSWSSARVINQTAHCCNGLASACAANGARSGGEIRGQKASRCRRLPPAATCRTLGHALHVRNGVALDCAERLGLSCQVGQLSHFRGARACRGSTSAPDLRLGRVIHGALWPT